MLLAGGACVSGDRATDTDGLRALQDAADATLTLPSFRWQVVRSERQESATITGEYQAPDRWHEVSDDGTDVFVAGDRRCLHRGVWPPGAGHRCAKGEALVARLFASLDDPEAVLSTGDDRLTVSGVPYVDGRPSIVTVVIRDGRVVRLDGVAGGTRIILRILDPGHAPPVSDPVCASDERGDGPPECPEP